MSSNDFKYFIACKGKLEVYLRPCQTSIMEHFSKIESKKSICIYLNHMTYPEKYRFSNFPP